MTNSLGYEFFTFLFFAALIEIAERLWPAHDIDRSEQRLLNIFALLVVAVGSKSSSYLIGQFCQQARMDQWFLPGQALWQLPSALKIVLAGVLIDFFLYWIHRGMHVWVPLWKSHRFHHTAKSIFWLSGSRTSFTHLFLFAIPQVIIPFYILRLTFIEAGILFSLNIVVNIWIHSNLAISFGSLSWFFITPAFHRIHHAAGSLSDKNLGFVHTLWDRFFGTYVDPKTVPQNFKLGLGDDRVRLRTVIGL